MVIRPTATRRVLGRTLALMLAVLGAWSPATPQVTAAPAPVQVRREAAVPPAPPAYPYHAEIQVVARKYRVAPELIAGIVRLESNFDRKCVSPVGALGLMQVMPATARLVARKLGWRRYDLFDPRTNLEIGTCYLAMLLREYQGHVPTALSFYNAGRHGIVSRGVYRNRRYIRWVMDNYWDYVKSEAVPTRGDYVSIATAR